MRCEEIQDRLDEYFDGDLPQEEAEVLARHLERCSPCQRQERSLRRLLSRAARLRREIPPRRDLWPGIASRLEGMPSQEERGAVVRRFPGPASPMVRRLALAAALAAVAMVAALLLKNPGTDPGEGHLAGQAPSDPTALESPGSPEAVPVAWTATSISDPEVESARRDLRQAVEARKDSLSPETAALIERNLRLIDEAIAEIQNALAKDPGNPQLQELLVANQRREIALLRTATFLPQDT